MDYFKEIFGAVGDTLKIRLVEPQSAAVLSAGMGHDSHQTPYFLATAKFPSHFSNDERVAFLTKPCPPGVSIIGGQREESELARDPSDTILIAIETDCDLARFIERLFRISLAAELAPC